MARARGADALMNVAYEAAYGSVPSNTADWFRLPFVSSALGEERGLIESDLLGQGRNPYDPTDDVVVNTGDLVIPVDVRGIGYWLTLLLGVPVSSTAQNAASGTIVFSAQPAVDSTVTLNGTAFTFKASGATGNQVNIGANVGATATALAAALNGSAVSGVAAATYSATGATLTIQHDTAGAVGNTFTLAAGAGSNGTVSGAVLTGGTVAHVFESGADDLPSASIEIVHPRVPSASVHFGAKANTLQIPFNRRGLLNGTLALIAQGETSETASSVAAASPAEPMIDRFAQATGSVSRDGVVMASVREGSMSISNALEPVEVIRPDSLIAGADPGMVMGSGSLTLLFDTRNAADSIGADNPAALTMAWERGPHSISFEFPRVFLPRVKRPTTGPGGIQSQHNWQAAGTPEQPLVTVTLVNDVAEYSIA